MTEPVVCVDGFSYEKQNIENWFKEQTDSGRAKNGFTSPVTGEKLQSTLLIRNVNLAKAIAKYVSGASLHLRPSAPEQESLASTSLYGKGGTPSSFTDALQFSPWSLGRCVTLEDRRSLAVKSIMPADTVDVYETIAFSAFPSRFTSDEKPRALFQVEKAKTGWGGLSLGFSPTPADKIKAADVKDFIDANAWWLDGSNWFHSPNGGAVLVNWSTSQLKQADRVGIMVPSHGRFCLYVNGQKKLDLKDTDLPVKAGTQLYGFVGLTGAYEQVRIIQDTPSDWGSDRH